MTIYHKKTSSQYFNNFSYILGDGDATYHENIGSEITQTDDSEKTQTVKIDILTADSGTTKMARKTSKKTHQVNSWNTPRVKRAALQKAKQKLIKK